MNKYYQFTVKYLKDQFSEPSELEVIGDIVAETEESLTVKYTLPFGKEEIRVFEKGSGIEFNHLPSFMTEKTKTKYLLTKLESRMFEAIEKARIHYGDAVGGNESCHIAEAVADVALELAYDAYNQGSSDAVEYYHGGPNKTFKQFIQDYFGN